MFKELQMGLAANLHKGIGSQLEQAMDVDNAFAKMISEKAANAGIHEDEVEALKEDVYIARGEGEEVTEDTIHLNDIEYDSTQAPAIPRSDAKAMEQMKTLNLMTKPSL